MKHVQAIVEVFPEGSLLNFFFEISVCGRNDTHIHFDRIVSPNLIDLPFLQHTQQLCLNTNRHFADFIQQKRASRGKFELAYSIFHCTGECAFFMAEQLGFYESLGKCGAVDFDKRTILSWTLEMN